MTTEGTAYDRYKHVREKIQAENQRNGALKPFSFEVYKKSIDEKLQLKLEKSKYKEFVRIQKGLAY